MPRRRPSSLLVVMLCISTLTAACGLKQDQLDKLNSQGGNALGGTTGGDLGGGAGSGGSSSGGSGIGGTTGTGSTSGTTGFSTSGSSGTSGSTGFSTSGGSTSGSTSGSSSSSGTSGSTGGGSTKCSTLGQNVPGVTPTEIRIGIHAPLTGAAPLPAQSFQDGVQVYWKNPAHKVCGRQVVVDFQDDKYTPQTARDVCGPMSRRDFLVVGAAGTDQIQSCATMPDLVKNGVPYLSAGVTTNGLTGLKSYFAFTLTYAQQAELVFRNAQQQKYGMKKWAVVTSNTNNFKDARDAMESVLKAHSVPFEDIQVDATGNDGIQQRAAGTGNKLATGGFDTVFVDTSPAYWIYMAGAANGQAFTGQYVGPGVTMTEVTVAQLVCSGTGNLVKANFLAPYPGIERASADFKTATGGKYDDIYWSLWGLSQALEQALNNAASLTRPAFIESLQAGQLAGGVYAPMKFNGGHFGGTGAYSLKINCAETQPNQSQPGSWNTLSGPLFK